MPNTVELETRECPLGCPPDDELVLIGRDRIHMLPGEFRVVRCRTCGLMRTNPRPTLETMGYYYPDNYGPFVGAEINAADNGPVPAWKRALRALLELNTERLPPVPPGRMLEVGCASGAFLHRMARRGWAVEGIEPSERAAQAARALGYRVQIGSLEQATAPAEPLDLVVGWMVLEHLHEPVAALRKLAGWVRPGGWLAISVPNAAALDFRLFRDAWYSLDVPRHTYHFTPQTLRRLLDAGGWRMERLLHQRVAIDLVCSLGYVFGDRGVAPGLARRLLDFPNQKYGMYYTFPLAFVLALVGQTGRMTVWARKMDVRSL
nr:MAG: class I SAM-dependent methyltransferase [Chloroflexota bacterium]